jgi:hypothetical protein
VKEKPVDKKTLGEQYLDNLRKAIAGERVAEIDIMEIPEGEYLSALEEISDEVVSHINAKREEMSNRDDS